MAKSIDDLIAKLADPGLVSEAELARLIDTALAGRPGAEQDRIRDAMMVRLANQCGIGAHGRQVNDLLGLSAAFGAPHVAEDMAACTVKGRDHYNVHPFRMTKAGAAAACVYRDAEGRLFVLLGHKRISWTPLKAGTQWVLPGGYMSPAALPGGANPLDGFDKDLSDTALRELTEETGIALPPGIKGELVAFDSRYGVTDERDAHTLGACYLVDLGVRDTAPVIEPGDDLSVAIWVAAEDLRKVDKREASGFASQHSRWRALAQGKVLPIRDDHGAALDTALRMARDKELSRYGFDRAGLLAAAKTVNHSLGAAPETEFGPVAETWHARALEAARKLSAALDARHTPNRGFKP
jgi:8-oxo-dGTP pyrophosphatase MutT (NUDIX family)